MSTHKIFVIVIVIIIIATFIYTFSRVKGKDRRSGFLLSLQKYLKK